MRQESVASARRIVVKVGSSSLTGPSGGIDDPRLVHLVGALAGARNGGRQMVLVSSGAIAAGLAPMGLDRRPRDLATQQAAASVGQGVLMHRYTEAFAGHGLTVGQVLLTTEDVVRRSRYRNAQRTLYRLLDMGIVPVVNENDTVATEEIRFGDNDRLAALVAHVSHADLLVLLSDVDGLYDGDPRRPGTSLIAEVTDVDQLREVQVGGTGPSGLGTGGMATKLAAAVIATSAGIPTILASAQAVTEVLGGAQVGTFFHPSGRRVSTRLLWLAHASTPRGALRLDDGAARAVVERRMSLLAAGITGIEGDFVAGDPVELLDESGRQLARGLVNFDAAELPALLGRSTGELARELGPAYRREVVHRDDLVLLREPAPSARPGRRRRSTPRDVPPLAAAEREVTLGAANVEVAMAVKPIRDGYPQVVPYLCVDGASAAIEFYGTVFGTVERMRMPAPGGRVGHAELALGSSVIMLADEFPDMGVQSPKGVGGTPVTISVYVEDVDAVFERAVGGGATVLRPVSDQFYGDRSGQFEDPFGHRWSVATHIEDVSPEEMNRRAADVMGG